MTSVRETTVRSGRWRGSVVDGVATFRGIRYATAERFSPPVPVEPHEIEIDAAERGPAAPQLPSRLEVVMGRPTPLAQSEDCLRLTVTTPAEPTDEPRPVLVWLHGGAYLTGSGEWAFYDAARLAAENGVVVVSVSYRLGALGFLRSDGVAPGNLGLLDQIAGLGWVSRHIGEFGGDASRVTLAGQSAGAHSIAAMMGIPRTEGLFSRVILQSLPLGIGFSESRARQVGTLFRSELGDDDPATCDVDSILQAQGRAARGAAAGGSPAAGITPPFGPVAGVDPLPGEQCWHDVLHERASRLPVLIGNTADEIAAFTPGLPSLDETAQAEVQEEIFDGPVRDLADSLTSGGAEVYRYEVGPLDDRNPYRACHCIELALLFGSDKAWAGAPMIEPLSAADVTELGRRSRSYWGEFVRHGELKNIGWPTHTPGSTYLHRLP